MNRKKQLILLFALIIIPVIVIFLSRLLFPANYILSSIYKIIFLFPLFYYFFIEKKSFKKSLFENFSFKTFRKNILLLIFIGIILASIYLLGFFLFKSYLDINNIVSKLQELASINVNNLIFIGLYIILINSLLEEFFWRGFIFKKLIKLVKPWTAHLSTGIAFSFHHIMFFYDWFTLGFFILVTIGLTIYSIIMNFIFQKYQDLFSCWIVHGIVDIAQIFIAFMIFGLI